MSLNVFNSYSKQKEPLQPLKASELSMYVCGVTVYDRCHLGHARVYLVFDAFIRYLTYCGYRVRYVRNITDIEDKIMKRAAEEGIEVSALVERSIRWMHEDFNGLELLPPEQEPRATHYIEAMIDLIQQLIAQGYAYVAANGDVCYRIAHYAEYGQLSRQNLALLRAGARVEVDNAKEDPLDFVLWKQSKPGELQWPSPWGLGRPGWHIECSAMAMQELGEQIDIHGGGVDLTFPHHENECAQTQAITQKALARHWMHVGFVQIEDEKMSKSLNNFTTIAELREQFFPEVIRFWVLNSHYRSGINYTLEGMRQAQSSLQRLYLSVRRYPLSSSWTKTHWTERFEAALQEDFNTPLALSVLFELARELNRSAGEQHASELANELRGLAQTLGLLKHPSEVFFQSSLNNLTLSIESIEQAIADRAQARAEKRWADADAVRQHLLAHHVILEDAHGETHWRFEP